MTWGQIRTEMVTDIMAVFTQYTIDGLKALHPQTVAALFQQAHRIERQRYKRMISPHVRGDVLDGMSDY